MRSLSVSPQVERLHVELAEAASAHATAQDEVRQLRDAQTNEALRAQRSRNELQRHASALDEKDAEAARLAKRLEAAEAALRQLKSDYELQLDQAPPPDP